MKFQLFLGMSRGILFGKAEAEYCLLRFGPVSLCFFIALSVLQRGDTVAFSEYMDKISRRMKTGMLGNLFHRELGMQ